MRRALIWILAVGCGGSSHGGLAIDDLPAAFEEALCTYFARCGYFPDVATCLNVNSLIIFHPNPSADAAVAAGKIIYDAGKARQCADAIAGATCDKTDADFRSFFPGVCNTYAHGTVHAGGECVFDIECISQSCNIPPSCPPDACCGGTCLGDAAPVPGQVGEACAMGSAPCVEHARCESSIGTCVALSPAGAPCTVGSDCDYGLGCAGAPSVCKALPQLGEPCPDGACRDEGQICKTTCVKVGLAGDPCGAEADCSFAYACDTTSLKCVEGPKLGQTCTDANPCFDRTFCKIPTGQTMGTCTAPQADGQPCTTAHECESGSCGGLNVCETPPVCI